MTNNDILRRLRFAFDINNAKMIAIFALADLKVSREQIGAWLKKEEDPAYKQCNDTQLACFLNGFINDKRGKRDGVQPEPEKRITNNLVFKKLRNALSLEADDILAILKLADYILSKPALSALFRFPDHKLYRECEDHTLRNFLNGLQLKYRPDAAPASATAKKDAKPEFKWQADRAPAQANTEKKETRKNEGEKAAFSLNDAPKASKPRPDKKGPLTTSKKKSNHQQPAFKWNED